jgi:hypothetical protein
MKNDPKFPPREDCNITRVHVHICKISVHTKIVLLDIFFKSGLPRSSLNAADVYE